MRHTLRAALLLAAIATDAGAQQPARITRLEFGPVPSDGSGITISVVGSGQCVYTIDFGDGTTERRTVTLPDRLQHGYNEDSAYDVVATPEAPCEGVARARLDIRSMTQGISRLTVEPGASTDAPEIVVNVEGRGTCRVVMDFGDGKTETIEAALPSKVSHVYGAPGAYELRATAEDPCRGDLRVKVDVKR
ncbi:MAG: hypothetical protein ICV72_15020 [Aldersonia sp.]|nr:hypothetical protein [Aldersonia sp.]